MFPFRFLELDRAHSSWALLATLAGLGLLAGLLFYVGVIGWALSIFSIVVRASIRRGFLVWERLFSWASWPVFLALVLAFLVLGWAAHPFVPPLTVLFALVPLFMGVTACLAYMFIDLERYEVERGYKAVHNPLKGQELAAHLGQYGHQVGVPLLVIAAVGTLAAFALLNQGLYESGGEDWYAVGSDRAAGPSFADFLAYALLHLLRIVDVLDLASSHRLLRVQFVREKAWPAAALLAAFKTFFTLVLLQQVFASLRQGRLLAETIADFWSPHEPIRERAQSALPQFGASVIGPLLWSLRTVSSLTKEQRDQLPLVLATLGPSAVPALVYHLRDPHEHVRAVAAAALGHLQALGALPALVSIAQDKSPLVRECVVEALGALTSAAAALTREKHGRSWALGARRRRARWLLWWKNRREPVQAQDPVELAVATLSAALADATAGVRMQAARALGRIGVHATPAAPALIERLKDADETVCGQAAEALGLIGGPAKIAVPALIEALQGPSSAIKVAAARALAALKKAAAPAVPALVALLQDREEAIRTAAAEAVEQIGGLDEVSTETLVEGLASSDNIVRAQTAEALGTIGAAASEAAPALVEAVGDSNDRVRAEAVKALGQMGEAAADVAVGSLVRALHDQDNWVSALAAEALGEMGESANEAVPALVRSLTHPSPVVRSNAAEALGKMEAGAAGARSALEKAARDEDAGARGQAIRALGAIGPPTPSSRRAVRAGLEDDDPTVRAAAVEAVGQWGEPDEEVVSRLISLLEDANDQVKVAVTKVLPKLAGPTPAVLDGLARLLEDDSAWAREHAAQALGKLGPAAGPAGPALLRAAQTGEVGVRESAMRALAIIQPPEAALAFASGIQDASEDVRKVASAGWMKATAIPEEVIPVLVEALHDPEPQVRANAAHALARLDTLPAEAIPLLIECAASPNDGLRINAAMALKLAPPESVADVMQHLAGDPNLRVRLIAASSLLATGLANEQAREVLVEALAGPTPRVRRAALELIESLGAGGAAFVEALRERAEVEEDAALREAVVRLAERLSTEAEPKAAPAAST